MRTRFKTEAQGNSEMADSILVSKRSPMVTSPF